MCEWMRACVGVSETIYWYFITMGVVLSNYLYYIIIILYILYGQRVKIMTVADLTVIGWYTHDHQRTFRPPSRCRLLNSFWFSVFFLHQLTHFTNHFCFQMRDFIGLIKTASSLCFVCILYLLECDPPSGTHHSTKLLRTIRTLGGNQLFDF